MKAIMLMFDSLRKDMLSAYGNEEVFTPNFQRLKEKTVMFENCFVGSMPCMPARRDLQTGRYNFMHRSWGPMEPYDNSFPEILRKKGIYTHLVTDHKHYWREGGATYHPKYNSYELIRGQEGDSWKGHVKQPIVNCDLKEPKLIQKFKSRSRSQDAINRLYMKDEKDHPLCQTVSRGIEFIDKNKDEDNWFLQIECFDPHEPFFVPQKYLDKYGIKDDFNGWPTYYFNNLEKGISSKIKNYYKALVTMCDEYVGKILDKMDEYRLWDNTMLIVNTDHGFLLGEHDWWGKNIMPVYNEIANIPFFIYDPRNQIKNITSYELVQNIDVAPTLLNYFHIDIPKEMMGINIADIINQTKKHEAIVYGYHGQNINICDGEYIYMRSPTQRDSIINEYTLMPTHINSMFGIEELKDMELSKPFDFTKGISLLKIPVKKMGGNKNVRFGNKLYSLADDREQLNPIVDLDKEYELILKMINIMKENDAPEELYEFYGFREISIDSLNKEHTEYQKQLYDKTYNIHFKDRETLEGFLTLVNFYQNDELIKECQFNKELSQDKLIEIIHKYVNPDQYDEIMYQVNLNMRLN